MFQTLRQNSQLYILDKSKMELNIGRVSSITQPIPKFPTNFMQNQEMVLDLTVTVDGSDLSYQRVPSNLDVADFGNIIIATNKNAMNAEIDNIKQRSLSIINSYNDNKKIVQECDKLISKLNPELAEKQAQQADILELKSQMSLMSKSINELMVANRNLVEQLKLNRNENVGN